MTTASWIWAADSNGAASTSAGNVAFLKEFTAPAGQSASSAVISMTAVDNFFLWVNGQPIGASSPAQDEWKTAQVLQAALNASSNVFSVLVVNGANSAAPPPGLLAAIQISYSGTNTTSLIVSDASWTASRNIPADFPTPVDPFQFTPAAVAASYGSGPWGKNVTVPSPDPTPLNLSGSTWIWSTAHAQASAAVGVVGFRRTLSTPGGKSAQTATVLLTVDNSFALYLNGNYVGAPPAGGNWNFAQQFTVDMNPTVNVFTVVAQNYAASATNTPTSAGLIGVIQVFYADGTSDIIRTDSSWLNSADFLTLPRFISTSDTLLNQSISLGALGMGPWGQIGTSNALDAASVPSAPFGSPSASASAGPLKHSVPVPAIVGAVVGGILLVLIVVAIVLLLWRHRRRNTVRSLHEVPVAFDSSLPISEYAATTPSAFPTPALATFGSGRPPSLPPPPAASRPRAKLDVGAVTRMNGTGDVSQVEYAEAPPPSYMDSESAVDGESWR